MRVFIAVLVLIFNLQFWTKADDIRDFELEGISVGDSLLIHLKKYNINKDSLKTNRFYYPGSKKFYGTRIMINDNDAQYDNIGFLLKDKDDEYIIYILTGRKTFPNNLAGCQKQKKKIVGQFMSLLKNAKRVDYTHKYPREDGKSISYITDFNFKDGSSIRVYCDNWSAETEKKMNVTETSEP